MREPGIGGGACGSPETAKTDLSSRLRTSVRRAIKTNYRAANGRGKGNLVEVLSGQLVVRLALIAGVG